MPTWTGTFAYELESSQVIGSHCATDECDLDLCPLHHPSSHPLASSPRCWDPVLGRMSRVCGHMNMHADPDDGPQLELCFCWCRCCVK